MSQTAISESLSDSLVSTARTALGDTLRTVVYFTPEEFDVLYTRSDLYGGDPERTRGIKGRFVDNERLGFDSQETYRELHEAADAEPDIGEYEFTIRVFSDGFVSRVIVDGHRPADHRQHGNPELRGVGHLASEGVGRGVVVTPDFSGDRHLFS
ncbi:DUF7522 family protein [Halorussus ruber]|uniref:DUF7522 family protein n=1 Tax=Halorussus ruber TaxID=1126238 RepID=UPI001FE8D0FB|nr:hypothetical protein [Halorussus ruber]